MMLSSQFSLFISVAQNIPRKTGVDAIAMVILWVVGVKSESQTCIESDIWELSGTAQLKLEQLGVRVSCSGASQHIVKGEETICDSFYRRVFRISQLDSTLTLKSV